MRRKPCSNSSSSTDTHRSNGISVSLLTTLVILSSAMSQNAFATNKQQCIDVLVSNNTLTPANNDSTDTQISADMTQSAADGRAVFEGDVIISQGQSSIQAQRALYDRDNQQLELQGDVRLDNGKLQLKANSGNMQSEDGVGSFLNVEYLLSDSGLRGLADRIDTGGNEHTNISNLHNTSITSCPPDAQDWLLQADSIEIDHAEQYGKAEDVTIEFKGVTFFYMPYMEFPIGDRRRSGLLIPEWSSSDSRGFELVVPWYWNIAPNHDATIAPHFMKKRGMQLDTDYRFLTRSSEGELKSAFLNEDDLTGERRYHTVYRQKTRLADKATLDIDIQDVSDIEYFNDFSNSLSDTSQTHLNRSARLTHYTQHWRNTLTLQAYETVDSNVTIGNRPYRKLPQLISNGRYNFYDETIKLDIDISFTEFDHQLDSKLTGKRLNFAPQLSRPFLGAAWYVEPAVRFNHINYQLDDNSEPDATNVMTSSLDAGLFFERSLGDDLLQTLEPRIFYLNTPFRDQSLAPIFDSSIPTFSFAQLFRYNRFNGGDRISDADQLTAAISTRIISTNTGDEYLRASVGQIAYLDERRVSLDGSTDSDRQSDLVAEISSQWRDWQFRSSWQWDNSTHDSERQNFRLRYQSDYDKLFNLAYRRQESANTTSAIEQSDVSFITPLNDSMSLFARWNYSLLDESNIDIIAGLGYDSCCWSLKVIAQRNRISDTTDEYDNSIQFQLVLKGLGSVSGNRLSSTLSDAIPGYYDNDI